MQPDEKAAAAVEARQVPAARVKSQFPQPLAARFEGRERRRLGEWFGLANFGVNLTRLAPGAISSFRHAHKTQDEFVFVLEGHPTLHTDQGSMRLAPGMCAGFRAGTGDAHNLSNNTSVDVWYLEIGDRSAGDEVSYPEEDLKGALVNGSWVFTRRNGEPL